MGNFIKNNFGICNLCNGIIVKLNNLDYGYRCINCRSSYVHRAIGLTINKYFEQKQNIQNVTVYELSSRGALFKFLQKKFKNLVFSEFYDDVTPGEYKNGIQCQDVQNLTFEDGSFELVTSTEVFEHVPDDLKGFREVVRVLKPNGKFIFTVPLFEVPTTIERAHFDKDGNLVHVLPPEYHGDRIRGKEHVLAFRNYGLDIVDRLKQAGFSSVEIARPSSLKHQIARKQVIVAEK
ncbi:methyltransferase domain-containing protein [Chitinophaga agrisoli]|uniref:Methyltransferase domain-containing protein n=1 Tax=Chitinophaga agrisoli TaxID=2607653 RepID=A0A5B2VRJ1_9BACT|nr:class I SAM-dependent methyltransferase [Chitinophaga agrisoli]KAA2241298.1 methyltransferase domain-containing protein [Chitinophaga agrisoli]